MRVPVRLIGVSTTAPSNSAVLQSLTYGHDANDAITAITNGVSSSLTQSFGYDALTRLTSVSSYSGNAAWTFDGNGNRMNQTTSTSSVAYAIASSSNRMLAAGARGFGFDALGNLTSDSGNGIAYHFDPFNRMDSSTKAGVTTTYHVNPLGQRTSKVTAGGSWSSFVYGADGPLLAENGPVGATDYLWLGGSLVGMVRNAALYAIHTDHLSRPELVTDPNRNVVWRASNFAYDRTVTQDNIGGLNIGFPGQYFDAETGLWNNGFRDYDASLGRYVESDPLGLAAGVNTYGYVGGNPVSGTDPYGLEGPEFALLSGGVIDHLPDRTVCLSGRQQATISGAVGGAVSGAMTFGKTWQGAVLGGITGAIVGGATSFFSYGKSGVASAVVSGGAGGLVDANPRAGVSGGIVAGVVSNGLSAQGYDQNVSNIVGAGVGGQVGGGIEGVKSGLAGAAATAFAAAALGAGNGCGCNK